MKKLISIIIPIHNSEKFISRCLNSIISQTYKDIEVILINDGSTDDSAEICEKYAREDSRIKIIHQDRQGVSKARNVGLQHSNGEYILFVDSDDFIESNMCKNLLTKINRDNCDMVFCRYNIVKNEQKIKVNEINLQSLVNDLNIKYLFYRSSQIKISEGVESIYGNVIGSTWRILYKKELLSNLKFDENITYMEDVVFLLNIFRMRHIKIGLLDEYLYNYVFNESSITNARGFDIVQNNVNFIKEVEQLIEDEELIRAIKFFCYSECVLYTIKHKRKLDIKLIEEWNSKENYKQHKKLTIGFKQRFKYFCIRYGLKGLLGLLLNLKKKK